MKIFARNYRGFQNVEIDTSKVNLLVGDNSCGKSSLIYLVAAVTQKDLTSVPKIGVNFSVDEYDYFSPYTNYEDVIFGFKNSQSGNFCKVITVKREISGEPSIIKCTYFSKDNFSSFRSTEKGFERKAGKCRSYHTDDLIAVHSSDKGYKKIAVDGNVSIGEPVMLLLASTENDKNRDRDKAIFSAAIDNIAVEARIVSPLRALPEKYYTFKRKLNAHGRHFASMWFDFNDGENSTEFDNIRVFGNESGLFESISVKKIAENIDDSPLVVTVTRSGKEFLLNQVGIGVSQVVPVLMDTVYSLQMNKFPLLMQQPELHLHPVAQAALGSYLARCSFRGLRPMIETHSSYLIDRMRAEIRNFDKSAASNKEAKLFDAEIVFCEKTDSGNIATHIAITQDGVLQGEPDSYHKFFVEEFVRTMF